MIAAWLVGVRSRELFATHECLSSYQIGMSACRPPRSRPWWPPRPASLTRPQWQVDIPLAWRGSAYRNITARRASHGRRDRSQFAQSVPYARCRNQRKTTAAAGVAVRWIWFWMPAVQPRTHRTPSAPNRDRDEGGPSRRLSNYLVLSM
jgi:hypothetical protein